MCRAATIRSVALGSKALDYMHARYCSPLLGRFLSVDPVNSAGPKTPQTWNKYAYVMGNPLRFVDPTGEYGRGAGFNDEEWERFNRSQERAARRMERRAEKLERTADKLERKGRSEKAAERRTAAGHLAAGAEALRSDGSDGRIANAVDQAVYRSMGGSVDGAAFVPNHGPVVTVNIDHPIWRSSGMQAQHAIGHESLHTAGLSDQRGPEPISMDRSRVEKHSGRCGGRPWLSSTLTISWTWSTDG